MGAILILGWIDSSIRVARRSDPLRRDTFHWRRLRIIFWGLIVVDTATLIGILLAASSVQGLTLLENIPFLALFLVLFFIASPALFLASQRSRDPTLHKNLRWFARFAVLVLFYAEFGYLSYVLGFPGNLVGVYLLASDIIHSVTSILPLIAAFSLYQSARSLAPLEPLALQ